MYTRIIMSNVINFRDFSNKKLFSDVQTGLYKLEDRFQAIGYTVKAFGDEKTSRINNFNEDQLIQIQHSIQSKLKLIERIIENDIPSESVEVVNYGLEMLGLSLDNDTLNKIKETDVVEVYNSSFQQIFHNFVFMDFCNYTLDEVYTYEFWELYKRPEFINMKLAEAGNKIFSGKSKFENLQIPEHDLEEIWSPSRTKMKINQGFIAPLYNKEKQVVAALTTLQAKIINEN
jgi:hypothetical protein